MNSTQRNTLIVTALILIIGGVASFFMLRNDAPEPAAPAAGTEIAIEDDVAPIVPETRQITADMRGYESREYKFGLLYPKDLQVREYKERDGALSVVFEAPDGKGFQIYAVPYAQDQITKERLQMDISSGVMKEPVDIVIAGVPARMFYSEHSLLGETREVWFINNGFLYEVVTYKALDEWLSGIMQTWQFI